MASRCAWAKFPANFVFLSCAGCQATAEEDFLSLHNTAQYEGHGDFQVNLGIDF